MTVRIPDRRFTQYLEARSIFFHFAPHQHEYDSGTAVYDAGGASRQTRKGMAVRPARGAS